MLNEPGNMKRSFMWSLLVHGTLLALLVFNGFHAPSSGNPPGGGTPEEQAKAEQQAKEDRTVQVEIIDPPKKSDEEAQKKAEEDGLLAAAPHLKDECPDFFGGIGITESYVPNGYNDQARGRIVVMEVHHGYPAESAGILVGDELLNSTEIRGEIGSKVTVLVNRRGQMISFEISRDKICTTPPTKKGTNP